MFDEEDMDSEALLVQGDDGTSVPLDRLQVRFSWQPDFLIIGYCFCPSLGIDVKALIKQLIFFGYKFNTMI